MEKRDIRKNEIIRDSIDVMYLKGYNSTSVNDIAIAASIPKGSFYNYFSDKEQYAVDAVHYYRDYMSRDNISTLRREDLTPLDRIRTFFTNSITRLVKHEYKMGCFVGNLAQEMGDVSEAISRATADFYKNIVSLIHENLVEARTNGEIESKSDLMTTASFIISAWQGSQIRMKAARDRKILDEFITMLNEKMLR